MSISKLPAPTPDQLRAAHQAADDAGTEARAFPGADEWRAEFPDLYTEAPDGKYDVAYRNPGLTAFDNDRNSQRVQAMLRPYQQAAGDITERRAAAVATVTVRGRDGATLTLPAGVEQKLAAKGQVTAVRHYGRATRYKQDRSGRWWKRPYRGQWEPDGRD